MNTIKLKETTLIGISLKNKTSNINGQSSIDCGNLWQEFEKGNYSALIPGKLTEEILAVYHNYEGDHTKPFSYFIGCKVNPNTEIPQGMESLIIADGEFQKINAKGIMPDCVINAWKEIWDTDHSRAYKMDFEVYDERSKDWSNAEVEIYLSLKN